MLHGAKNVWHGAENVQHDAKNVRHGAEIVRHGAKNVCPSIPKYPQDPPSSIPQILRPTDQHTMAYNRTMNKQHLKYRATPYFQSRGEFEIWSLAITRFKHNLQ